MLVAHDTNDAGNNIDLLAYIPPDRCAPAAIVNDLTADPTQIVTGPAAA